MKNCKFIKIIFFLPILLFSKNLYFDFSTCYEKYKNIKYLIPINKNRSITFIKPTNYLFYDPFTKMYVIKSINSSYIPFSSNPKLGWFMAAINFESVYGGTFAKDMLFLSPAKLSTKSPKNTIISDIFCRAYGIGSGDGFIKSEYIKHFVKYGYWGDVGIEVDREMRVKYIDPFYVEGIKRGDKIVFINGRKATYKVFVKYILFGKLGERVKITTNKKTLILKIRKKIYEFTPLIHYGIVVDKNLYIKKIPKKIYEKTFLTPPVKLVAINGKKVFSLDDIRKQLFSKNVTITLQKDGINITIPLRQ